MSIPSRRWYQFSLRTLLIAVALAAPLFGWIGSSLNWIRQRKESLANRFEMEYFDNPGPAAPDGLWLFGEYGIGELRVPKGATNDAKRLFPEANVVEVDVPCLWRPSWVPRRKGHGT